MIASIKSVNVFVNDSTKAHDFYANKLGFEVRSDITIGNGYRWLEVLPKGSQTAIVLAPPEDGQKVGAIMNIILTTDDIQATYKDLLAKGVHFLAEPKQQDWGGTTTNFTDADGNEFMLLQENTAMPTWEAQAADQ